MPGAMAVLRDGKTHFQIGDNENLFDMTYIENAAHAHILAAIKLLEQPTTPKTAEVGRVDGEAFFITNGEPVYFWDFMRAIWRRYQNPPNDKFTVMPAGFGMVIGTLAEAASWITGKEPTFSRFRVRFTTMNRYFNIKKARVYLDYEPIVSLEEGLRRACDAWDEQEREKNEKKGQ
jgi:sterol-4alpha-carboxylate 3-dehydrogenase (decarboxylating)